MLRVLTGPYSTRDPDRLDITRAGCDKAPRARKAAPGEILAPSWRILNTALEWRLRFEDECLARGADVHDVIDRWYRDAYTAEMCTSYRLRRAEWEALLRRDRIVLVCFCRDPLRCHRSLAAEILAKLGAVNEGEIRAEATCQPR
jgi:hypothetical protein